ncbi:MAG: hypothetical protein WCJ56_05235 [bacterium]
MKLLVYLTILPLLFCLVSAPGWAQGDYDDDYSSTPPPVALTERPTQLTDVAVEKTASVLRIRITLDGPAQMQNNSGLLNESTRISFILKNTRFQVPAYVSIDTFPVSHLELSTDPRDTKATIVTLVSYTKVNLTSSGGEDYSQYAQGEAPRVMITSSSPTEVNIQVALDRTTKVKEFTRAPAHTEVTGSRDLLTLKCVNSSLGAVLQQLSEKIGTPIYLDIEKEPNISINLELVTAVQALQAIALGYGLNVEDTGQAYFVTTVVAKNASSYSRTNQRTIPLRYLMPNDCLLMLPTPAYRALRVNDDGKSFSAVGSPALLDKITRDIALLDQPSYHINLQVTAISCEENKETAQKIEQLLFAGHTNIEYPSPGISVSAGKTNADEIIASLTVLISTRRAMIKSVSSVQVLNGKTANIFVGQTILMQIDDYGYTYIEPTDVGTQLSVTPSTSSEWINLTTNIQNSFVQDTNSLGPLVSSQEVSSSLRVKSGDTIVIGGLRVKSNEKAREHMPLAIEKYKAAVDIPKSKNSDDKIHFTWLLLTAITAENAIAYPLKMDEVIK